MNSTATKIKYSTKSPKPLPEQDRLSELFDYNPESGVMTWKELKYPKVNTGSFDAYGYQRFGIDGFQFKAQRLIWMLMTGDDPGIMQVDHINGERADNRWVNLQLLSQADNKKKRHRKQRRTVNDDLPRGVFPQPSGRYSAKVQSDRKVHHCGTYDTPYKASVAAAMYGLALHGKASTYSF